MGPTSNIKRLDRGKDNDDNAVLAHQTVRHAGRVPARRSERHTSLFFRQRLIDAHRLAQQEIVSAAETISFCPPKRVPFSGEVACGQLHAQASSFSLG